jgi:rfaE bifunctional protein kinase chain/domain
MLEADAVLLSDYGAGLVTPKFAAKVHAMLQRERHPIPVLIDTRYQLLQYHGLTACTPNESEVEQALGVRINDDLETLERAGREILARTAMAAVVITRGSRGMALFQPDSRTVHIPIHGTDEIADVTGAGDTVMATMALALAAGATFEAGAMLANYAGGIVVMKRGTATVTAEELRVAIATGASAARARPERSTTPHRSRRRAHRRAKGAGGSATAKRGA